MDAKQHTPAAIERRAAALERVVEKRAHEAGLSVDATIKTVEEKFVAENGARVVARAWTDPDFRRRLLADGKAAVAELGIPLTPIHRQLFVLENTLKVHNVIVCTQCSCNAMTLLGPAPDWYEDLEYRARVVRESRTVLSEMGCVLPPETEIRVWDTTADVRYMVLPVQPPETVGWPEDKLASIVTRDSLIGVARL
jgi:nitrile hydratase subunit alpha